MLGGLFQFASPSLVCSQPPSKNLIQVQINPNVELLGFVYFLGYEGAQLETNDSYLKTRPIKRSEWYNYGFSLYKQYKPYQHSKHLSVIMTYAERIWLDYLINLLLQLDDFPQARLKAQITEHDYLRFSPTNDPQEARQNATLFIDAMNQLYQEVDFKHYLRTSANRYANALTQVRHGLPEQKLIPAMEAFYGRRFDQYVLAPSLTIPPGMGFGLQYTLAQKTRTFHVFGPFNPQQFDQEHTLNMGFDDPKHLLELSTHEFSHPFVNPVIDSLPEELINRTASLFEPIKQPMANQGYTRWKSCLYEHFVRAGEILIAQNLGHRKRAAQLKSHYIIDRHFIYLPTILQQLEIYHKQRVYSYKQAVERAMQRLEKWGSRVPYKQLSQSIQDDGQVLHVQINGVRWNDEKISYNRNFSVVNLTAQQRDSLKTHILDSLGVKPPVVVSPNNFPKDTEVTITCSQCGRKGYLEVYGNGTVSTRKINLRQGDSYRFPIFMRLGVGDYRLIYRSWPSKPIRSTFHIEGDQPAFIEIK